MSAINLPKCPSCHSYFYLKGDGKLNSLIVPGLLDCGHDICSQCVSKAQQRSQKSVSCSICKCDSPAVFRRNLFILGCLYENKKPSNFSLSKLSLVKNPVQPRSFNHTLSDEVNCGVCHYSNAKLECKDCGLLCKMCSAQKHSFLTDLSSHIITLIEDKSDNWGKLLTCETHGEPIDFFCTDCKIPVCPSCGFGFHRGHDVTKSEIYIRDNPNIIEEAVSKANRIGKVLEQSIYEVKKALKVRKVESENFASKIKAEFNYLHGLLQLKQEQILNESGVEDRNLNEENNLKQLVRNCSEMAKFVNAGKMFLKETKRDEMYLKEELKLLLKVDDMACCIEPIKRIEVNPTFSLKNETFDDFLKSLSFEVISPIDFQFKSISEILPETLSCSIFDKSDQFSKNKTTDNTLNELPLGQTSVKTGKKSFVNKLLPKRYSSLKCTGNSEPIDFFSVKVVHIISPHEFYVIKESNLESLEISMTELKNSSFINLDQGVEIDQLYLLNDDRYGWVRCRVMNVSETVDLESDGNTNLSCDCFFLDFGCAKTVEISKLRKADAKWSSFPPFAIKCSLYQLKPIDKEKDWSIEAIDQMNKFVLDRIVLMTVFERVGETLIVDLGDLRNNILYPDLPYSVRDSLIFLEHACFALPLTYRYEKKSFSTSSLFYKNLEKKVQVVHCRSPSDFYVILNDYSDALSNMLDEINNLSLEMMEPFSCPIIGLPCLAVHENFWYRGEIVNTKKGRKIVVSFVDFGNKDTVCYKNVRCMDEKYLSLPKMAIKCCLADVEPVNIEWTEDAKNSFMDMVNEKILTLRVENLNDKALQVSLRTDEECVNTVLVREGYCVSTGPSSLIQDGKQIMEEDSFVNDSTDTSQSSDNSCNELKSVTVVYAYDPSCIYIRYADLEEKYLSFMEELKLEGNKSLESDILNVWQENDKCIYLTDNLWHRAEITKLDEEDVFNIDEGTTSTVSRNSLHHLPKIFCDLAPFAIQCHLYGIIPAGGRAWSFLALSKLSELVEKDKIYLLKLEKETDGSIAVDLLIKKCTVAGPVEPVVTSYESFVKSLIDNGLALPKKECRSHHLEALRAFQPKVEETSNFHQGKSQFVKKEKETITNFELNDYSYDLTNIFCESSEVKTKTNTSNCNSELRMSNEQIGDLEEALKLEVESRILRWKQNDYMFSKRDRLNIVVRSTMENGELWFNLELFAETLNSVNKAIQLWVESCNYSKEKSLEFSHRIRIGGDCIAQFDEDGWFRANVLEIIGILPHQRFKVIFIDYGSVRVVSSSEIGPYDGPAIDVPQQAFSCHLHGVRPISGKVWNVEALDWLCKMTEGKLFKLTVMVPPCGNDLMQVCLKGPGKLSLNKEMINAKHAIEYPVVTTKKPKPVINSLKETVVHHGGQQNDMKIGDIPIGTDFKVKVVRATAEPDCFFAELIPASFADPNIQAIIINKKKHLEDLTALLSTRAPNWAQVLHVEKGSLCCAFSAVRNIWVRIEIEDIKDDNKVAAFYVDFGDIETIPVENLRTIDESFDQYEYQAMMFKLHQVFRNGNAWNINVIEFMNRIYSENNFYVVLKSKIEAHPVLIQVDLYENELVSSEKPSAKLIYQDLIDSGLIDLLDSTAQEQLS